MNEQINERLSLKQQEIHRLQKIESMLTTLRLELSSLERKVDLAKAELDKENHDYEQISAKSLSSLLYTILGNLEERTEKERREAVEAQLRYNQLLQNLEDTEYQISKLESERCKYENAQTEYDLLYRQKLRFLTQKNGNTAREIMELEGHIQRSKSNLREIGEAIAIGNDVLQSLGEAAKSLSSAKDWGVWDILGGGLVANMIKHSHIDEANKTVQHTQSLLRRFRTELADVRITEEMRVDISDFAKLADYFFDGLFADLFVQDKIKASLESVHAVQNQVQGVMSRLHEINNAEQSMQEHLNEKIRKLIIEA